MNIHCFQHVPFETPAEIKLWAEKNNHSFTTTYLFDTPVFPRLNNIDALVIMGGPMSVTEENKYPWLQQEKKFISDAIEREKKVLGVCLGAQLIADVLGARVYGNKYKEIGWYPVELKREFLNISENRQSSLTVFHWHGETFELPHGADHLAESEACKNQGFIYKGNTLGLQFHIEMNRESLSALISNCRHDLTGGKYVQSEEDIINQIDIYFESNRLLLNILLSKFFSQGNDH